MKIESGLMSGGGGGAIVSVFSDYSHRYVIHVLPHIKSPASPIMNHCRKGKVQFPPRPHHLTPVQVMHYAL